MLCFQLLQALKVTFHAKNSILSARVSIALALKPKHNRVNHHLCGIGERNEAQKRTKIES